MTKEEIKKLIDSFAGKKDRTLVIIDYGNMEKWKHSLKWSVGIKELSQLCKNFSTGKKFLRRFYYGSDFGKDDKSQRLIDWSRMILDKAKIKDSFYNGELKCKFCGETITVDNIYSFLPESGALNLICCKEECISDLLNYIDKKTKTKIDS